MGASPAAALLVNAAMMMSDDAACIRYVEAAFVKW
jgi:hypothetical protein